MNNLPNEKPKLVIKAQSIGPIMRMDQTLSDLKQNLIFARNGTGKSFIARALRLLDRAAFSGMDTSQVPNMLVSEESSGQGSFGLYENDKCIGEFALDTNTKSVLISEPQYIFHVFSEDYVDENLRNKLEELDGDITHEIIVGKENAELDENEKLLGEKEDKRKALREALNDDFLKDKNDHQKKFAIRASLGAFRGLSTDAFFQQQPYVVELLPANRTVT